MIEKETAREYFKNAFEDIHRTKEIYPFIEVISPPTVVPVPIQLKVVAVKAEFFEKIHAEREDFTGPFSRELEIIIPFDYRETGCKVYGGKWIDTKLVKTEYQHFNDKRKDGAYLFCVGVPESFPQMENAILENIRTAENMLVAYEMYQTGKTKTLELKAYSHGNKGIDEYRKDRKKYKGK